MSPTDALVVLGLMAGSIGILALALALVALVSRAIQTAYDAAGRHIDTCLTQALQIPLYPNLEEEHRALIKNEQR